MGLNGAFRQFSGYAGALKRFLRDHQLERSLIVLLDTLIDH